MKELFFFVLLFIAFSCNNSDINTEQSVPVQQEVAFTYFVDTPISITVNPSGRNPLAAVLEFDCTEPCQATIRINGEEPLEHTFKGWNTHHRLPVIGLYQNRENGVTITLHSVTGRNASTNVLIKTGKVPAYVPSFRVEKLDTTNMQKGWHLLEVHIGGMYGGLQSCPVMFDNKGEVRWLLDLPGITMQWAIKRREDNGHYFTAGEGFYNEWDILGSNVKRIGLPYSHQHHDQILMSDGTIIALDDKPDKQILKNSRYITPIEDHVVQFLPDGTKITEWDLSQILDVDRTDLIDGGADWFHSNSIWYDDSDQTLIISGRMQGVVKVDMNNNLRWIIAPHKDWGNSGPTGQGTSTVPYLLTAVNAAGIPYPDKVQQGTEAAPDFDWCWTQHAAMTLPDGNILMFDNGTMRNFGAESQFSRAVEYRVNSYQKTIQQVWEYSGKERELYSGIISDVDYDTDTQNKLITFGILNNDHARIIEISKQGKEVFEAKIEFSNINGIVMEWAGFDILYRSERMMPYPPTL